MSDRRELFLAIDTSAGTSVAVVDAEHGVLSEANGYDTMKHAEVIGRLIEQALAEASVSAGDITAVVAGMGPGPFTGLRVGIAAAHAFATGRGIEVLPVVSHDAVARVAQHDGHRGELLVVSDARRREVYWSLYTLPEATEATEATASAAATAASVPDSTPAQPAIAPSAPVRLDGPGLAKPDALPHPHAAKLDAAHVSAAALGLVAADLRRSGAAFADDRALYLRSPDVTLSTGAKRVTQR
ncbi:tRNA (adenosine(37)-N6)-threonylcarbamoyltransferase complex dimerization subunit type 1 TsaB [Subtercola endophyticus]|uniref:tRNA (adenosine(37)-N6)-threonylcarbamoyltransferase complex dimerization subunit type 1 TsaB n=1 Tax=Subtercola endophyticus TaxID=2895559 RepID=UPI001E3B680D|nr:tRNA (adenosine(37)-N6)-threonylcarbamoyltransferase complex dimerization subunit type 1 TsaB [Subtercola endophyticus]UFS59365.1 tRNA (adenosine(37)-N6)-threonylcarbamoyltransferase complex dimerization subunit type 1 TsaB [Subtercola endophyticus]